MLDYVVPAAAAIGADVNTIPITPSAARAALPSRA